MNRSCCMGIPIFIIGWLAFFGQVDIDNLILAMPLRCLAVVGIFGGGVMIFAGAIASSPTFERTEIMNIGRPRWREVIEPRKRQGAIIGYKWLDVFSHPGAFKLYSPRGDEWKGFKLEADVLPEMDNENGIYACFAPDDPELRHYKTANSVLVEIELRGQKIIHETGARAQVAIIKEILEAGSEVQHFISVGGGKYEPINLGKFYKRK